MNFKQNHYIYLYVNRTVKRNILIERSTHISVKCSNNEWLIRLNKPKLGVL